MDGELDNVDDHPLTLSLQDMCMLCIMLRLEEFPTDSLALLPSAIRRRLFLGLAHADLLHVDTEVLFGDLHYSGLDPSREERGPAVAREELLDIILHGTTASAFFSLNLEATLDCYQWVKSTPWRDGEFDLIKHICKCYPSLEATMVPPHLYFKDGVVLPKRFLQFVIRHWNYSGTCELHVPLELARPLLQYCKMQRAPQNLMIDCCRFQTTMLWKKFEEDCDHLRNESPIEMMDPVIPFLQDFLSSVEVLEVGTDILKSKMCETMPTVLYVILYNIVTSSQPRLKHLKILGLPLLTNWGFNKVYELIFTTKSKESVLEVVYKSVPLASNLPRPYPLEGLSVLYPSTLSILFADVNYAPSLIQFLVECHMHTLKHVTIQGMSFCYHDDAMDVEGCDEVKIFCKRKVNVLASLTQLLRKPQFRALSVGKSSLSEACALIKAFLTTPASHEQTLYVEGLGLDEQDLMGREEKDNSNEEEQEEITSDSDEDTFVVKRQKITKQSKKLPERIESCSTWSHNTPQTNAQFKCLDLGHSSSCIHSLLFSLPELKLKKLRMRTQDMTLVLAGTTIKVEHVVFSTQTHTSYKPILSLAHLEKFTISNPVLKKLEFEHPTDECAPGLIPAFPDPLSVQALPTRKRTG